MRQLTSIGHLLLWTLTSFLVQQSKFRLCKASPFDKAIDTTKAFLNSGATQLHHTWRRENNESETADTASEKVTVASPKRTANTTGDNLAKRGDDIVDFSGLDEVEAPWLRSVLGTHREPLPAEPDLAERRRERSPPRVAQLEKEIDGAIEQDLAQERNSNVSPYPLPSPAVPTTQADPNDPIDLTSPPRQQPHPHLAEPYVDNGHWIERSLGLNALERYPNERQVTGLLDQINQHFFSLFAPDVFDVSRAPIAHSPVTVRSLVHEYEFGDFICRLAWYNPHVLAYPPTPEGNPVLPPGIRLNPRDYLVRLAPHGLWAENRIFYHESPVLRALYLTPGESELTLYRYLQMRLMSFRRYGNRYHYTMERWYQGMGGVLRTNDGNFGFAYRIWEASSGAIPMEKNRKPSVGPGDDILPDFVAYLYREYRRIQ
ncbi:MAG: hypothetical protein M1831_000377 [Alyxoria varia]|nr:MAG: hypothetical protein M1831_000377 [Alyxoria varia]